MQAAMPMATVGTDFAAAERENRRNTAALIALLMMLAFAVGGSAGALVGLELAPHVALGERVIFFASAIGALLVAGAATTWAAIALSFGDDIVLSLAGARPIDGGEAQQLVNIVEEMAIAAGLPRPRIAIIDSPALNAFATGLEREFGTIVVTRGLLRVLERSELQGVVAHEISHLRHLDSRYLTVVSLFAGFVALAAEAGRHLLRLAGHRRDRADRFGPLAPVILIVAVFVGVLAPLAAAALRAAVSREREFLADAGAIRLTRDPEGLIGALAKLSACDAALDSGSTALRALFVVDPFRQAAGPGGWLDTHPAIDDRIARLRRLGA